MTEKRITKRPQLTQERLKQLVTYCPETGEFMRIIPRTAKPKRVTKGAWAYSTHKYMGLDGHSYSLHRMAWLYVYGENPGGSIDHIDGDPENNRIANLRAITQAENAQNRFRPNRHSTSGFLGVTACGTKWRASLVVLGKRISFGLHATPEEAHQAYLAGKRIHHPYGEIAKVAV